MTKSELRGLHVALGAAVLCSIQPVAHAQGAQDESDVAPLEQVIVTAQKRSENINDVPMAITAVSGDQLLKQGITSPIDLEKVVPSFTYQQSSYGTPIFTIRGVGFYDTSISGSPTVSVYLDEVPLPYSVMTKGISLDLSRIEALKGPQGTLFGQNSTGGAINYIAAKPTNETQADLIVDYGRFNLANVEGHLSGELAPGLRARLSGRYEYQDAWQDSYAASDVALGKQPGDTLGKRRFATSRLLLDWEASDELSLTLSVNGWTDGSDTQAQRFRQFAGQTARDALNSDVYDAFENVPATPQDNGRLAGWDAGTDFARDDWFYQTSLRGDLELDGGMKLTSITAYSRYRERSVTDPDGTAWLDLRNVEFGDLESLYQELRLAGEAGRLRWLVGGNYARDQSDEDQINLLGGTNAHAGPFAFDSNVIHNAQDAKTWAGFGSLDFTLTDSVKLGVSARYTNQKRDFTGCLGDPGNGQIAAAFGTLFSTPTQPGGCITMASPTDPTLLSTVNKSLDEDNVSWRTAIDWSVTDDALLYASISRGYKAGSFSSVPGVFSFQFDPVTQESLLSYETGFKVTALDRKVQLNGATFYYKYSDKQVLGSAYIAPFGNLPTLVNIPKSRAYGAELELTATLVRGLRTTLGGTYLNSKVQENPVGALTLDMFGNSTSYVGESFTNTPRWQGVADIEYGFEAGSMKPFAGMTVRARSGSYATFGANPEAYIDAYQVVDLRAGVETADGKWRVLVWGRNVFDKYYVVNVARYLDTVTETAGMPATYGVTAQCKF